MDEWRHGNGEAWRHRGITEKWLAYSLKLTAYNNDLTATTEAWMNGGIETAMHGGIEAWKRRKDSLELIKKSYGFFA